MNRRREFITLLDALKAALIEARAKLSGAEALIEHLRLVIARSRVLRSFLDH